jgi:hypothetical protein
MDELEERGNYEHKTGFGLDILYADMVSLPW